MKFAILTKFKELLRSGVTYTAVLSITVGLLFLIITIGYTYDINTNIERTATSLLVPDAAFVKVDELDQTQRSSLITVVEESEVFLESPSFKTIDSVRKIERSWNQIYRLDFMTELEWDIFHSNPNLFLIDKHAAEEYSLKAGDTLRVDGKEFRCMKVIDHYTLSYWVVFGEGADLEWQRPIQYLTYFSESVIDANDIGEFTKVADLQSMHIDMLENGKIMVFFVMFLFISVVIFNTTAVNSGIRDMAQRNDGIKFLLGESKGFRLTRNVIERIILYSLAYHLACVIYFVFLDWIPLQLRFEFTTAVYLVGYVVTLLFSVLAPILDFLVSMRKHTKTLVRW